MKKTTVKPWPSDAVMIVASPPCRSDVQKMESPTRQICRECGDQVLVDNLTLRRALTHPARFGRPVRFFCPDCARRHDFTRLDYFEDHRVSRPVLTDA